jgi:F0F1-type ATP synthase assembly protein I
MDDPFEKVKAELEAMELPGKESEEALEDRLRRKISESDLSITPDEEVDRRTAEFEDEVARAGGTRVPEPEDFEARLRSLEHKTRTVVGQRKEQKREFDRRQRADAQSTKGLGVGLTAAYAILGMPLVGALIGYFIDRSLGTEIYLGILTLIGAVAGVVFAILTIREKGDKV